MRPWPALRYTLVALVLSPVVCYGAQVAWSSNQTTTSKTLITALSDDPDYESLLKLIMRARLVPTLNRLNGSTLFAPTNDAIKKHKGLYSMLQDDATELKDNVQEQLRQQLWYHLLNYSITDLPNNEPNPQVHKTLHFPHTSVDPPSKEPPPYPPWMPIPGGTLGGEPQRLRVAAREGRAFVGVDAFGTGGAEITKGKVDAGNGVLLGIADVLEPPSDLAHVVSQHASVSYFHKVLTPEIIKLLNTTAELTLFLPVDKAWDVLDDYERIYLESQFATDDLKLILNEHAVVQKHIAWSESFEPALNLTTLSGSQLEVVVSPDKTMVSSAQLIQPDIYASNGVLHLVDSLLIPPGTLKVTPEKSLLALNCTTFVSLIHSVNLTHLINSTDSKYTVLALSDDTISLLGDEDLPERGKWTQKKLKQGMLLETSLEEAALDRGRQVMEVQISGSDKGKPLVDPSISFGGAGVSAEHDANSTYIYFVSRPIPPPTDALATAFTFIDLSTFLSAIFSTSLADVLKTTPRTTLLFPDNSAFKRLGMLVSAYFLLPSAKADLEKVILHHTLDGVEYAESLQNGSQRTFASLEGSDITLQRHAINDSMLITASGGWTGMRSELVTKNILTQSGVIHELTDILIPRSVDLTIGKLLKAAKVTTMTTLVNKAGMDWFLNGTAPPEDSPWADLGAVGWTFLCPSDDAFKSHNVTELTKDEDLLRSVVAQHLIPMPSKQRFDAHDDLNNNRPLVMDDSVTYSTLQSPNAAYGDVVFRQQEDGTYVVGIKGARGTEGRDDYGRVLAWGRSTIGSGTGGVILIDSLIEPYQPSWWFEIGAPVGVGVFGVGLICLFFFGVRAVWRRDTTEATYEPSSEAPAAEEFSGNATTESIKAFIAGGFGGVSAVLVGHPFDLTKTRLQTAAPGAYTGAVDVVKQILARDGVRGMYRGMVPPLLGVTPIFALSFWAYDASKKLILSATPNRSSDVLSTGELAAAGFLSAVPTTLVTAPVERAKVLLQIQGQGGSGRQYTGVLDVMKHLYKEGGMRSIFRGSFATLARDGPGSAAYFAAYEVTKKALTPAGATPADLNLGAIIFAGGTAGVAMWAIAIPPDVLKSRLQSAPTGTYSGFMDCARKTIAQDGVAALWKGFGPAMGRAFPANAATFLGVEASRKLLDSLF
ncbi:hypothetical protein EYR38_000611 [Pleurotus pulmonarius]|nr:hypothetical protein EYR38_000611 [Pleurotus pulmonarius]